jgi:hypothetical protein
VVLDRIETVGHAENKEDIQVVSELMDDIRDAVIACQVSGNLKAFLRPRVEATRPDGKTAGHI